MSTPKIFWNGEEIHPTEARARLEAWRKPTLRSALKHIWCRVAHEKYFRRVGMPRMAQVLYFTDFQCKKCGCFHPSVITWKNL